MGTLFYNTQEPKPLRRLRQELNLDYKFYDLIKIFERHFMLKEHKDYQTPLRNFLKELNKSVTEEEFNYFLSILKLNPLSIKPFPNTLEVLKKLKQNHKLFLLSNAEPLSFKKLNKDYKLGNYFDELFLSYEEKIIKPDKEFFQKILSKHNLKPTEVVMVGDSLNDDVLAAKNIGIKGILIDRNNKNANYNNKINSLCELEKFL